MRSRDADILIIPGLGGSGPDHWQTRWQARLPNARRVEQDDWERPNRAAWAARVAEGVAACERPVVAVAHSCGVPAFVWAVFEGLRPIAGAFLVAPPSETALGGIAAVDRAFVPYPTAPLPCPTLLVGSRSDPYAIFEDTEALAAAWGVTLLDAGDAGHINSDSGHGPWPEGLMAFGGFLSKL